MFRDSIEFDAVVLMSSRSSREREDREADCGVVPISALQKNSLPGRAQSKIEGQAAGPHGLIAQFSCSSRRRRVHRRIPIGTIDRIPT